MTDRALTPKALMTVVEMSVSIAMKTPIVSCGMGDAEARSNPQMLAMTNGTVMATAVVVRTPAQK